jgi:FG-GAP-like repeat
MPARLVQVTLVNNSDFPIVWQDDGRPSGAWQQPWYPSNVKHLAKGEQAVWRMESDGIATGLKGWVLFKVDVPLAPNIGPRTEFFSLSFERPYIGEFSRSISYSLQDPRTQDPPHPGPALAFVKDVAVADIANIDSSPFEFVVGLPAPPIAAPILLANEESPKHVAWLVEVANTGLSSTLSPLQTAAHAKNDLLWHNASTGETQIWLMDGAKVTGRATVVAENGSPALIGPPWSIVGSADMNGDGHSDIVWHNAATGEIQIWFMDGYKLTSRATVLGESSQPAFIGPPWSIVAVNDMTGDGKADLIWHNASTGETQFWLMNGFKVTGRATVLAENGSPALVGLPWSIVAVNDMNGDGKADLIWHNAATGETQIWFLQGNRLTGRGSVLGENGAVAHVGPPWSIVGSGLFATVRIA